MVDIYDHSKHLAIRLLVGFVLLFLTLGVTGCGKEVEPAANANADGTSENKMKSESLESLLAERRASSMANTPPEILEIGQRARAELLSSGMIELALNVGDKVPSFSLSNAVGDQVNSDEVFKNGKTILTFYRGHW